MNIKLFAQSGSSIFSLRGTIMTWKDRLKGKPPNEELNQLLKKNGGRPCELAFKQFRIY